MDRARLLIRADASAAIGMGHVIRCISLAEALAERAAGAATFVMAEPPAGFELRAARIGAEIRTTTAASGSGEDARETLAVAEGVNADWTVLDGYGFDHRFQTALVAGGRRVLALDDHGHCSSYRADLVLNQNAGADAAMCAERSSETRLLLGPEFALLGEGFRAWHGARSAVPARARRVVVTLGGSDPDNVSARALTGWPPCRVRSRSC